MASTTLTHSQNTSPTSEPDWFDEERSIKYRKLNEFAKYVEYKEQAEKRDSIRNIEMENLKAQNEKLQNIVDIYEKETIPLLREQNEILSQKFSAQEEITGSIAREWEARYERLKSKRFVLGVGGVFGYGTSLDASAISGLTPTVGIGLTLSYTLFRF